MRILQRLRLIVAIVIFVAVTTILQHSHPPLASARQILDQSSQRMWIWKAHMAVQINPITFYYDPVEGARIYAPVDNGHLYRVKVTPSAGTSVWNVQVTTSNSKVQSRPTVLPASKLVVTGAMDSGQVVAIHDNSGSSSSIAWSATDNGWQFSRGFLVGDRVWYAGVGLISVLAATGTNKKTYQDPLSSIDSNASPLCRNNVCHFGAKNKNFYAVDITDPNSLTLKWKRDTKGEMYTQSPTFGEESGFIFQATAGDSKSNPTVPSQLVALDASTGEIKWTRDGMRARDPCVGFGLVFVGSGAFVHGLRQLDGTTAWKTHMLENFGDNNCLVHRGLLYFPAGSRVYGVEARTGTRLWMSESVADFWAGESGAETRYIDMGYGPECEGMLFGQTTKGVVYAFRVANFTFTETLSEEATVSPGDRTVTETATFDDPSLWGPSRTRVATRSRSLTMQSATQSFHYNSSTTSDTRSFPTRSHSASRSRSRKTKTLTLPLTETESVSQSASGMPECAKNLHAVLWDAEALPDASSSSSSSSTKTQQQRQTAELLRSAEVELVLHLRMRPTEWGATPPSTTTTTPSPPPPPQQQQQSQQPGTDNNNNNNNNNSSSSTTNNINNVAPPPPNFDPFPPAEMRFSKYLTPSDFGIRVEGARLKLLRVQQSGMHTAKLFVEPLDVSDMRDVTVKISISANAFDCAFYSYSYSAAGRIIRRQQQEKEDAPAATVMVSSSLMFNRRYRFLPSNVVVAVQKTAAVSTVVAGFLPASGGRTLTSALRQQRSFVLMRAMTCTPPAMDEPMNALLSPLQLSVGTRARYGRGAVVGNMVLFVGVTFGFVVLIVAVELYKRYFTSSSKTRRGWIFCAKAQARFAFPGLIFVILILLVEGTITGAMQLVLLAENGVTSRSDKLLISLSFFVFVSPFVLIIKPVLLPCGRFEEASRVVQSSVDREEMRSRRVDSCIVKMHNYFFTNILSLNKWKIKKEFRDQFPKKFCDRYGPIFDPYSKRLYFCALCEFLLAVVSSASLGLFAIPNPEACLAAKLVMALVVGLTVALSFQAPYSSGWELWHNHASAFSVLASSLCLLVGQLAGNEQMELAAEFFDFMLNVISAFKANADMFVLSILFLAAIMPASTSFAVFPFSKAPKRNQEKKRTRR